MQRYGETLRAMRSAFSQRGGGRSAPRASPAAPPSKTIAFDDDDGFSPYACCSVWSQCVAKERPKSLDDTPVEYNGASPLV